MLSTISNTTGSHSLLGQPLPASSALRLPDEDSEEFQALAQLAGQLLENPTAMRRLSERVLEMLILDIRH